MSLICELEIPIILALNNSTLSFWSTCMTRCSQLEFGEIYQPNVHVMNHCKLYSHSTLLYNHPENTIWPAGVTKSIILLDRVKLLLNQKPDNQLPEVICHNS